MTKKHTAVLLILPLLLVACQSPPHSLRGNLYDPARPAPDFSLPSTQDGTFQLSQQSGRIVLLFFGYTSCPDVCPATIGEAAWVLDQLGDAADQVRFVFITVDPQRDTLDRLTAYLGGVDSRLIGLRPDPETLGSLLAAYGATAVVEASDDPEVYFITHTARIFLINQGGLLFANYDFASPKEDLLADLETLLEGNE